MSYERRDVWTLLHEAAEKQGWNTDSQLDLALEYIQNQGANDAFRDFLQYAIEDESV